MFPGTNIKKGNQKLDKVTELTLTYKDVISPECVADIRTAQEFACAIREEYAAAKSRSAIRSVVHRMILAKQFDDAASKALTRTIHITDAGLRDAERRRLAGPESTPSQSARPADPDAAIVEEEPATEDDLTYEESIVDGNGTTNDRQSRSESKTHSPTDDRGRTRHASTSRYSNVRILTQSSNAGGANTTTAVSFGGMCNPEMSIEAGRIRFG